MLLTSSIWRLDSHHILLVHTASLGELVGIAPEGWSTVQYRYNRYLTVNSHPFQGFIKSFPPAGSGMACGFTQI